MRHDGLRRLGWPVLALALVAALASLPTTAAAGAAPAAETPDIYAVTAPGPGDYWAVGSLNGDVYAQHYDGTAWESSPMPRPKGNDNSLGAAVSTGPDDVWAFGERSHHLGSSRPIAEHWDGTQWTLSARPNPREANFSHVYAASADAPDDVWVAGTDYTFRGAGPAYEGYIEHFDGSTWTVVGLDESITSVNALVALAPDDVWAAVEGPAGGNWMLHYDGTDWSLVELPVPAEISGCHLYAMSATGPDDVWLAGQVYKDRLSMYVAFAWHFDGSAWHMVAVRRPPPQEGDILRMASAGPTDIWALETAYHGATRFVHSGGGAFSPKRTLAGNVSIAAMTMASPTDGVAVGATKDPETGASLFLALHYDGTHWTRMPR